MARKKRSGADLAARFAKISEEITTESEKALFDIGSKVKQAAQQLAPVHSGKLSAGYAVRMRHRGTQPVAVVGTLVPYATYVEFAKDIGGKRYGKKLRPPARVLYKALDDNVDELERLIASAVSKVLNGVEGA